MTMVFYKMYEQMPIQSPMKDDVNLLQYLWVWENYTNKDYSQINPGCVFFFFSPLARKRKKKTSIKPFPGYLIPVLNRDAKYINSLKITDQFRVKTELLVKGKDLWNTKQFIHACINRQWLELETENDLLPLNEEFL